MAMLPPFYYAVPQGMLPYPPQPYPNQGGLAPQGLLGGALGSLLGGAVGGLFGGSGSDIGQAIGGIAGGFLPLSAGPNLAVAGAEPGSQDPSKPPRPVLLPQSFLDPTQLARRHLIQASAKGFIDQLMNYLTTNQSLEPQLAEVTPLVQRAVELYKASDYERSGIQSYLAFHTLESARAKHPELPAVFS